jgi:RHH-type rel operon transcriptional repressor/antitoxin RelB
MLGLRLEKELEERLDRFAAQRMRTRSDVARAAVREYLDRHSIDEEFRRQVRMLEALPTAADADRSADRTDEWLRRLDEEDGGYDWGDAGPPH